MKYRDIENEWLRKWFQFILDNPDKDWHWFYLSENPNVTWEIVQNNPEYKLAQRSLLRLYHY